MKFYWKRDDTRTSLGQRGRQDHAAQRTLDEAKDLLWREVENRYRAVAGEAASRRVAPAVE